MIELEEERIEQEALNKEQEAISMKERFLARSKSRSKSPALPKKPQSKAEMREAAADTSIFTAHDGGYILEYKPPPPYQIGPELPPANLPVAPKSPPKKELKQLARYADGNWKCLSCGRARCTAVECILLK